MDRVGEGAPRPSLCNHCDQHGKSHRLHKGAHACPPLFRARYWTRPRTNRGHDRVAQVELSTLPGLGAAVVETDVWTGVTATVPGGVWAAVLRAGAGAHRFVILGPAGGQ